MASKIYYLNTSNVWTALTDADLATMAEKQVDTTIAEKCCFIVNGSSNNLYLEENGLSVILATNTAGHLYNSPIANKINYYKDRLYLADYIVGSIRKKSGIAFSSMPVGIVALASEDADAGSTTLEVTETKYIRSSDSLDVYRGNTLIETITITGKTDSSITVNATSNAIEAADELWVAGTFSGAKLFRWADRPTSGVSVKEYDNFNITCGQNARIKMLTNIGDVMMIATNNSLSAWNDSNLRNFDMNIGCVSDNGYVKQGSLFFLHYTGIYQTDGTAPVLISDKVKPYIDGATKSGLESGAMGKKGESIYCSIGDSTLYNEDGSIEKILENVVLEYNLRQKNWFVHTGLELQQFCTYPKETDSKSLQAINSGDNKVYEVFINETDDGVEIPFRMDTQVIDFGGEIENIFYPMNIIIDVERGANIHVFVKMDGDDWYEMKHTARKGANIIKINGKDETRSSPPRCRKMRISLRHNEKQICKISKISLDYLNSVEEEEHRN